MHRGPIRVQHGREISALVERMQIEDQEKIGSGEEPALHQHHTAGSSAGILLIKWWTDTVTNTISVCPNIEHRTKH